MSDSEAALSHDIPPKTAKKASELVNNGSSDFSDAISLFKTLMENQFQCLEKKFEERVSANAQSLKKKFTESAYEKPKGEGNKIQYKFNLDILDDLEQVLKLLEAESSVATLITKVIDKLRVRNKHIRIADASPAGWRTVSEYETNELADDSDDEKKIRSAEQRAIRLRKASRPYNRFNPYRGGYNPQVQQHNYSYKISKPLLLLLGLSLTSLFVASAAPSGEVAGRSLPTYATSATSRDTNRCPLNGNAAATSLGSGAGPVSR